MTVGIKSTIRTPYTSCDQLRIYNWFYITLDISLSLALSFCIGLQKSIREACHIPHKFA